MPGYWSRTDERQYKAILASCTRSGRKKKTCKRIAAATVNTRRKRRRRRGTGTAPCGCGGE